MLRYANILIEFHMCTPLFYRAPPNTSVNDFVGFMPCACRACTHISAKWHRYVSIYSPIPFCHTTPFWLISPIPSFFRVYIAILLCRRMMYCTIANGLDWHITFDSNINIRSVDKSNSVVHIFLKQMVPILLSPRTPTVYIHAELLKYLNTLVKWDHDWHRYFNPQKCFVVDSHVHELWHTLTTQ